MDCGLPHAHIKQSINSKIKSTKKKKPWLLFFQKVVKKYDNEVSFLYVSKLHNLLLRPIM